MFSYISGKLAEKNQNYVVIDVHGVGFKIFTSNTSLADPSLANESEVTFHTYMYIKEGIMDLYGFSTKEELEMFELLITVNGVGAKGALSILSLTSPSKLAVAIVTDDVQTIKKAAGVGAKTAQRVCMELKDKIKNDDLISKGCDSPEIITPDIGTDARADAVSALTVLGYTRQEAQRAVGAVREKYDDPESYIKHALKNLM